MVILSFNQSIYQFNSYFILIDHRLIPSHHHPRPFSGMEGSDSRISSGAASDEMEHERSATVDVALKDDLR
jgi:hypothetical protein